MFTIAEQEASGSPLFDVRVAGWESLLNWGRRREYPAGSIVYHANQIYQEIFYLHRGLVKQFILTVNGVEKVIGLIKPGNLVGEALFFHRCPAQCTVVALEDSVIYAFSRHTMEHLFRAHPNLLLEIIRSLSYKTRLLTTQIGIMASGDAETKVGKVLYLLAQRSQEENPVIRLTHQALADLAGVHRVTASNVLARLKKEGVLEFRRGCLVVKKPNQLLRYRFA